MKMQKLLLPILMGLCLWIDMTFAAAFRTAEHTIITNYQCNAQAILLADIHFDPFAACDRKKSFCPTIALLQKSSVAEWRKILSSAEASVANSRSVKFSGTTFKIWDAMLAAVKKLHAQKKFEFGLVLGDSLAHQFKKNFKKFSNDKSQIAYEQFVEKTFEFIALELSANISGINIYPVFGNNDSFRGNYRVRLNDSFYKHVYAAWKLLLSENNIYNELANMRLSAGYYHIQLTPALDLIVLNTNFFSKKTTGVSSTAAIGHEEMVWLNAQLVKVQANHKKVLIAFHIPPSIDLHVGSKIKLFSVYIFWYSELIEEFHELMSKYASVIEGVLNGHLHMNTLYIKTYAKNVPFVGVSAISPVLGGEPHFTTMCFGSNSELTSLTTWQ